MNKLVKKIAVTFVTALLICGVSLNAFAVSYLAPINGMDTLEQLPYGLNTCVIDVKCDIYQDDPNSIIRVYANNDCQFWVTRQVYQYNSSQYRYEIHVISNEPIFTQLALSLNNGVYTASTGINKETYVEEEPYPGYSYYYYFAYNLPKSMTYIYSATKPYSRPSNDTATGFTVLTNSVKVYPTVADVQNGEVVSKVGQGFTDVNNKLQEGFSGLNNNLNQGFTQAVDDILNAGSDRPTLDTNNDWMNDSLTKVNEWVSSLDSFKQQMNDAKEENASNMQQAKTFINGFFDVLPKGIIAILTLGLVMIVVVKVIGR